MFFFFCYKFLTVLRTWGSPNHVCVSKFHVSKLYLQSFPSRLSRRATISSRLHHTACHTYQINQANNQINQTRLFERSIVCAKRLAVHKQSNNSLWGSKCSYASKSQKTTAHKCMLPCQRHYKKCISYNNSVIHWRNIV